LFLLPYKRSWQTKAPSMAQNCRPINRAQAGRAHFPKKKWKRLIIPTLTHGKCAMIRGLLITRLFGALSSSDKLWLHDNYLSANWLRLRKLWAYWIADKRTPYKYVSASKQTPPPPLISPNPETNSFRTFRSTAMKTEGSPSAELVCLPISFNRRALAGAARIGNRLFKWLLLF